MVAVGGSCWELVYMQQISLREILLGDQIPEYVGSVDFIDGGKLYNVVLFAQRKRVIFQKE
jgi:hypothetical protein